MIDIEAIKADRETGTPGPWHVSGVKMKWRTTVSDQILQGYAIGPYGGAVGMSFYSDEYHREQWTNASRIARVPDLEDAVIENEFEREIDRVVLAETLAERDALTARVAELESALGMLHHAVCGPTGFAEAVRGESGKAYPWPALSIADSAARAALAKPGDAP